MRKAWLYMWLGWAAVCAPVGARAAVFMTQQEALEKAFPGATVERRTVALTKEQLTEAARLAGEPIPSALVFVYEARRDGELVGTAYFDVHRVRTLPQTLMLVVAPDGRLRSIDVLAFRELPEYLASPAWLDQFPGRALDDGLNLRRDIQGITGATLTARATTKAVRRILAIHAALQNSR
jgi:Na+-translocating ferredoxin:NAD+ oxidoreductase RnfG subunit